MKMLRSKLSFITDMRYGEYCRPSLRHGCFPLSPTCDFNRILR